jgi:hypothetical protein
VASPSRSRLFFPTTMVTKVLRLLTVTLLLEKSRL